MNKSEKPSPPDPLVEAGILLRGFVEHGLTQHDGERDRTHQVVAKVRELLAEAETAGCLVEDPLRFLAVQQTCDALERHAQGNGDVTVERATFRAAVENHQGGPTDVPLGGQKIRNKKTAEENFLRAAAVVLWETHPSDRDQLVADARKLLGVKNREALRRLVDNHHRRHDVDLEISRSPLSVHIPLVGRLMASNGWRSLWDFAPDPSGYPTPTP